MALISILKMKKYYSYYWKWQSLFKEILYRYFTILLILFLATSCAAPKHLIDIPDNPPPSRKIENVRIALVLGGGGAKGMAHVGILEVLEKYNIPIDLIVGTSSGSVVGAMYADTLDSKMIYNALIDVKKWDLLDVSLLDSFNFFSDFRAPVQGYYLQDFILKNILTYNIEDLKIPFIAVATELRSGYSYEFSSGPVALGVLASASIPPIFAPVMAYNKIFVDGGVLEPVPVSIAKQYHPQLIIAVDVTSPGRGLEVYNMLDVMNKSFYLNYYQLSKSQTTTADIIIHPDLSGFGIFDDDNNYKIYQLGKMEALKKMPEILQKIREKHIKIN